MGSFWVKELCRVVMALSPPGWSDLWLSDVKRIFVGCVKQVGYKRSNSSQFFHTLLFERKKESEVTQSCPTLCHPMDCSLPGYSVHGIFHARVLEWVAMLMGLGQGSSLVAQMVKCLPAMRETWVQSQGWEDPLEMEMATHSNTLAWKIPWTE